MRRFALLLVCALLAACAPKPVNAPTVLTYGTPYAPTHPFSRADRIWMDFVASRSAGRLVIKPYWSGALLSSDHSMIEVRHDVVDIGLITPIYARGGAEVLRAQSGFYGGVRSYAGQLTVYDCLAAEFPDFRRETEGLVVLAVQGGNFPGVLTRGHPIRSLADFQGVRLRAPTELTGVLAKLGADPVNMPMGEVYSALAKGVIDGVVAPADTLQSLHFNEVAKYFSGARFARGAYPARAMSKEAWDRLDEANRQVLTESRKVWEDAMRTQITDAEAAGAKFGASNGIEFDAFDAADQVKLDTLYNDIAAKTANDLSRIAADGAPIYARAQSIIADINAGRSPACATGKSAP
ncbi:MAG: TRAP transporter substrate-binding protein DctP [Alphaproteobacteria bacterium]